MATSHVNGRRPRISAAFYCIAPNSSARNIRRFMILKLALIAPQTLFNADCRLIGAGVSVGRHSFGFERYSGIEMERAFGLETESVLADGGMARITAIEIFRRCLIHARGDALTQCNTNIKVFPRNAKGHISPPDATERRGFLAEFF